MRRLLDDPAHISAHLREYSRQGQLDLAREIAEEAS